MNKNFVLLKDIVIKAGTVLSRAANERGGEGVVECVVGMGDDSHAWFSMGVDSIQDAPEDLITEIK